MKLNIGLGLSLLLAGQAYALTGQIVDERGNPVAGADIEVRGTPTHWSTNNEGYFDIPLSEVDEIHVVASGFSHQVIHLHGQYESPLVIRLSQSVIEVVDVIGLPMHISKIESAQPVSVLAGDELRARQASTLGDTLKYEVGVQTTYFGGVASSPIIRGLDGPRVLITQNGLDAGDASRVGPDHIVTAEASTAEQIEILRGPATLFYGSGAIGGVVNIVDDRVPKDSETNAALMSEYNTVNEESAISGAYTGGNERIAVHVDAFWRESEDYNIPGPANNETEEEHAEHEEHEDHDDEKLENSAAKSQGFNIGSSLLLDNGYVGLAYGRIERSNGVPGHAEHGEEEADHDDEEAESEERVISELEQDRWQLLSELSLDNNYLTAINTRIGYTDYQHSELHAEEEEAHEADEEHHEEGTVFKNKTLQARVDFIHAEFGGWNGAVSLESKKTDFEAIGEEAFTPPSITKDVALAIIEEKHSGPLLWQLGARIESVQIEANHSDDEHSHDDGDEHADEVNLSDYDFTPASVSLGLVWDYTPGYNIGVALAHAERAPSAAELFSNGAHLATQTYEFGALYELHNEDGEVHAEYAGNADKEVSNNIDLTWRKFEGDVGFVVNVFYNQISDYYTLTNTGLITDDLHDADADPDHADEHHDILPVYIYEQQDVTLKGLELEFAWRFHPNAKWTIWGDTVDAQLDNGEYLPRTSPTRLASRLNFDRGRWGAELSAVNYFEQDKVALNETATDGYTLIDARVAYTMPISASDLTIYLAGSNLTDEYARVHTSFLKDQAPLPGRNLKLGLAFDF